MTTNNNSLNSIAARSSACYLEDKRLLQFESKFSSAFFFPRESQEWECQMREPQKNENKETEEGKKRRRRKLTAQTTPNLCPANSATWLLSARSQMRTEGWWPHSPVTRYLPSAEKATAVSVLRDGLTMWVWRFLRGLNNTTAHLSTNNKEEEE